MSHSDRFATHADSWYVYSFARTPISPQTRSHMLMQSALVNCSRPRYAKNRPPAVAEKMCVQYCKGDTFLPLREDEQNYDVIVR